MSWRRTTLLRENDTVGPWGKCETVKAVGVPRCSCKRIMSVKPLFSAEDTSSPKTVFPRFRRIEPGSNSRISFEKAANRVDGSRDVVTSTRGSTIPDKCAYSSSRSSSS